MTGPKILAIVIFGCLTFIIGWVLSIGIIGVPAGTIAGLVVAGLSVAAIYMADTGKQAFARGFLAMGIALVVVPLAGFMGVTEQVADLAADGINPDTVVSDEAVGETVVTTLLAGAGFVFGIFVGAIFILIGTLMHRTPRAPVSAPPQDTP